MSKKGFFERSRSGTIKWGGGKNRAEVGSGTP